MSREDLAGARAAIKLLRAWAAEDWERVQLLCPDECRPTAAMVEHLVAAVAAAASELGRTIGCHPYQLLDDVGLFDTHLRNEVHRCALREAVAGLLARNPSRLDAAASKLKPLDTWDLTVALAETAVELYRRISRLRDEGEDVEYLVIEAGRRLGVRPLQRAV